MLFSDKINYQLSIVNYQLKKVVSLQKYLRSENNGQKGYKIFKTSFLGCGRE